MFDELQKLLDALQTDVWSKPQQHAAGAADDAKSIAESVESPVGDHPPLSQSVFAGDQVAVVIQADLVQPKSVVEQVLRCLMETNVEPTDITVVLSEKTGGAFELALPAPSTEEKPFDPEYQHPLDNEFRSVNFLMHDSNDEQSVAYIAANAVGLPVKINRCIVDADIVLTIGSPRPNQSDEDVADCVYPEFSNDETRQRYFERKDSVHDRTLEMQLANDMLGVFFTIQLVTGIGDHIANVVSGERWTATSLARTECEQLWQVDTVGDADMAVATIETEPSQQRWKDFAQALIAANSVAVGSGPILIWSEIFERPKAEFRKAFNQSFETGKASKLSRTLQNVAGILAERQVFLKSRLSQNLTEELGLGYFERYSDVERLISGQTSGVLIRDAHLCQVLLQLENVDAQR